MCRQRQYRQRRALKINVSRKLDLRFSTETDAGLRAVVTVAEPTRGRVAGRGNRGRRPIAHTAGDYPDRLRSESAFVHLCGVRAGPRPAVAVTASTSRRRLLRQQRPLHLRPRPPALRGARTRAHSPTPADGPCQPTKEDLSKAEGLAQVA